MPDQIHPADLLRSHIIVVSALTSNRMIYEKLAVSAGRRVGVQTFVHEALALQSLEQRRADLAITDLRNSSLDGTAFVRELSAYHVAGAVPAIVVTPDRSQSTRERALEAGVIDIWYVPLDPLECRTRVRNLLRFALVEWNRHCPS